jgi:hypothetical protein
MEQYKAEIIALFTKAWFWLVGVTVGVIGRICYDVMTGKKLTLLQVLATAGVSIAVGCITALWCMSRGFEQFEGAFMVSCCTWMGDKLVVIAMSANWSKLADKWAEWRLKK